MLSTESTNNDYAPTTAEQYMGLLVYVAFVAISFACFVASVVSPTAARLFNASFAWPGTGIFYLASLQCALPPLLRSHASPTKWHLRGLQGFLLILAIYGLALFLVEYFYRRPGTLQTPFLIWTFFANVCIPILWYVMFRHLRNANE